MIFIVLFLVKGDFVMNCKGNVRDVLFMGAVLFAIAFVGFIAVFSFNTMSDLMKVTDVFNSTPEAVAVLDSTSSGIVLFDYFALAVFVGFALAVVYENPYEQLRVINLFQGFQPFQNSAFALVPRNFRMAKQDATRRLPNGQITHITVEGDETLSNGVG